MKKMLPMILVLALGLVPPALAQDPAPGSAPESEALLFQEIPSVFAASKYEQKVTEAPSWVSLVTAEEIKKYGYRTLAEILQSLPGFYLTYDRLYTAAGVRGFGRPGDYNGRILLMVDGHRLNEPIYDTAALGTEFPLDVDLIERVEVIRGPSSSLYGTNALFAVVNVLTRRGRNVKGVEVSGEAASFDTYKGRLSWGNKCRNDVEALLSATIYDTPGQRLYIREFDSPETNGGVTQGTDYDKYHQGFMNLSYGDFKIQGLYGDRKKGIPNGTYGVNFNDPGSYAVDKRGYLDLIYERIFGDQWQVKGRAYYDYYHYYGDYNYPEGEVWSDSGKSQWFGAELQVTRTFWDRHKISLGAEYRYHFDMELQAFTKAPYESYLNYSSSDAVLALYGQDEYRILKNLILNLGLRYDRYETFGDTLNPRLALIYNPLEKTTLKLIYGSAFRAPNLNELYYQDNVYKANPDLKPEKIQTYEAVLEQILGEHFRLGLSGYYYNIRDLIAQYEDPADNLLVFRNLDEVETYGADLELGGKWKNGIEGRISYSWQDSVNKQTSQTLLNSPRHMVKANLVLPLWNNRIFAGLEGRYVSPRKTLAGADTGEVYVFNFNLFGRRLLPGLEVSLGVYNVFDAAYGDPGSGEHLVDRILQDGRTFRVKLTYNF